jgi:nucleoside-diphosphate-sugar epimerase
VYYASSSTAKEPHRNPYALTKYTLEQLAPEKSLGMRFTTVYGTQTRPQMFVPKLLRKEVTYINNHTRDFIHVSDVCRAITMFVQKNINGVIDVGTGKSYHLQQLLDAYGIDTIPMQEGNEHERKDNKADTNQLTAIGMVPRIDVIDYLCQEKELDKSEFSKYNVTIGD